MPVFKAQSDGRLFNSDSLDGATRDAGEPVVEVDPETGDEIKVKKDDAKADKADAPFKEEKTK